MNRKTLFLLLGGIIIGVGLGVLILYGFGDGELLPGADVQTGPSGPQPAANFPAPDFTLERLDGQQVSLQDHRGKYVLLNFWATWCAPCREEMPHIQAQYEQHSAALAVLAIDADEPKEGVQAFADELSLTFDVLLDPGGEIQDLYQLRGYPTSMFVDPDGIIQVVHIGFMSEGQLTGYLEELGIAE